MNKLLRILAVLSLTGVFLIASGCSDAAENTVSKDSLQVEFSEKLEAFQLFVTNNMSTVKSTVEGKTVGALSEEDAHYANPDGASSGVSRFDVDYEMQEYIISYDWRSDEYILYAKCVAEDGNFYHTQMTFNAEFVCIDHRFGNTQQYETLGTLPDSDATVIDKPTLSDEDPAGYTPPSDYTFPDDIHSYEPTEVQE